MWPSNSLLSHLLGNIARCAHLREKLFVQKHESERKKALTASYIRLRPLSEVFFSASYYLWIAIFRRFSPRNANENLESKFSCWKYSAHTQMECMRHERDEGGRELDIVENSCRIVELINLSDICTGSYSVMR